LLLLLRTIQPLLHGLIARGLAAVVGRRIKERMNAKLLGICSAIGVVVCYTGLIEVGSLSDRAWDTAAKDALRS
jgi:hypothetical protein